MLPGLTSLLLFNLAGDLTVRWLALPFPGPVIGMLLLFAFLIFRGSVPTSIGAASETLLRHLMLVLVPPTAGLMLYLGRLEEWIVIGLATIGGTAITIVVTGSILHLLLRLGSGRPR
jgi:holin-like protein